MRFGVEKEADGDLYTIEPSGNTPAERPGAC